MKKTIYILICIIVLFYTVETVYSASDPSGILRIKTDGASPKEHQALSMTVDSIPSNSPLQAFCIGWNFTFTNQEVSSAPVSVYVPLSGINTGGGTRTYTFPLTTGWTREFTGIEGGKSIRDLVDNKAVYDKIIKEGCVVHANAKILKYKYTEGKPAPMGTYSNGANSPPNVFADTWKDIEYIDVNGNRCGNFTEFSETFKTNTKSDYYELSLTLAAEPIPLPKVALELPENNSTVPLGTAVTFRGYGTGCHHIGGFVDGKIYGTEQVNPKDDLNKEMTYEVTVILNQAKDYTFQIKGRNTALAEDADSVIAVSEIHTVHVVAPEPDKGNIHIKCLDYNTNKIISDSTISNISYGTSKIISGPEINSYCAKGSYLTYGGKASLIPPLLYMQPGVLTQSVILSDTDQNAYLYFWYEEVKGPVALIDAPQKVQAGNEFTVSATRSYCKQAGAVITAYDWSTGLKQASGTVCFENPGTYSIKLTVADSNGLKGSTVHEIEVTPPTPAANINISGKLKENRKIVISAKLSNTPNFYPMRWDKTEWYIEPDIGTGATWDFGVKLRDGTVIKLLQNTDQRFLNGQSDFFFQARDSGIYKVKLSLTNTYPANDTITGTIAVTEDKPPVVVLEAPNINLRENENPIDGTKRKFGITAISDKSYSPDGDTIGKRIWSYRYNSSNNTDSMGKDIFTDDITKYRYTGALSEPFLPEEGSRLLVKDDNSETAELWWYDVGLYRIDLIAEEVIPFEDTIKELLLPSDIRSSVITGW
ncbi:hypothetical protein LY28_00298 [Ruminiclostridium sufflavum DSM 19573]|uniref:PKD domain-containing protein n=1 Tax=Ruminiclostridium sufflavum DSM 19573 TaxID=1121337 RepID=A0A318XQM3_9FIRM|nr:PKD domain-containing protein [Ruminiclostridium sufflavum]PYG89706.1 hypothetical protein LY28_00298 [Ruminiclostridium sufflavum DSM 19573]